MKRLGRYEVLAHIAEGGMAVLTSHQEVAIAAGVAQTLRLAA